MRSWIESRGRYPRIPWSSVDLLVRSWIERIISLLRNAVSSGRPPCEVVNWKDFKHFSYKNNITSTSLWGRELKENPQIRPKFAIKSTSLWGRELKDLKGCPVLVYPGRPPCEVVNWKSLKPGAIVWDDRRPPCEVVNWKSAVDDRGHFFWSTSLWGRELKGYYKPLNPV